MNLSKFLKHLFLAKCKLKYLNKTINNLRLKIYYYFLF